MIKFLLWLSSVFFFQLGRNKPTIHCAVAIYVFYLSGFCLTEEHRSPHILLDQLQQAN